MQSSRKLYVQWSLDRPTDLPTPYAFWLPATKAILSMNSEHEYGTSSQTIIAYNPWHKASAGGIAIDISSVFLLHFVSFSNPNTD